MRLLLDVTAAHRPGIERGIGRYLDALRSANKTLGNDVHEVAVRTGQRRVSELLALPSRTRALRRHEYDVFHAPTAYYTAVDLRRRPIVTSILDLIPLELADHRQTGLKARLVHYLAGRSDAVLTLSEHTASRLHARLGIDRARIVVAPLPPAPAFVPNGSIDSTLARPYVAMLVDLRTPDPRKRAHWIPTIARELLGNDVSLVVAGGGTEALDLPGVVGLGRVDDQRWAAVLRGAEILAYTSAYEGQGLPPLEAIACGTPVVAMSNTAIPEVVGDAGILVEDHGANADAPQLAAAALGLISDRRQRDILAGACSAQADRFTADGFARQLDLAYTNAIAGCS